MNKNIIDARNKDCPLPLIMLKKALLENCKGFLLLINNPIAKENITRFLTENKVDFEFTEDNGSYKFFVNNPDNSYTEKSKVINQAPATTGKHIICIKSDKMGHGSDELGLILLKAFINNLKEVAPLPSAIIFYNNGVKLTLKNSAVIDSLIELNSYGVKILVCGACVDYYNIKEMIGVGIISNMYEITEQLTNASHVIYP